MALIGFRSPLTYHPWPWSEYTEAQKTYPYHIERAKTFDRVEDQEQKERCQFFERCGLEDVSENF